MAVKHPLIPGIYVPTLPIFNANTEDLDLPTIAKHALWLAQCGVTGIAVQGSNGEAVHLARDERDAITSTTRQILDENGFSSMPLIVGCGAQSTRETIQLCKDAADAGGDYALVLPPSYYMALYVATTVVDFFHEVATASPIPIIVYSYPGVVSGLDMNADTLIAIGQHPNVVGCKFTCGNTGKLNRVATAFRRGSEFTAQAVPPAPFTCLGGSGDFTLQTLIGGGAGIIGGIGNIAPKTCVRVMRLYQEGKLQEAQEAQAILAKGDWGAIKGGIVGTKVAMQKLLGYGGWARRPLPRPEGAEAEAMVEAFRELWEYELTL